MDRSILSQMEFPVTPAEQNLIEDLFNRIRSQGVAEHDSEADALIGRLVRGTPNAAYALVQSILVQDQALRQADQRLSTLERRQPMGNAGGSLLGPADYPRGNASPTSQSVPVASAPQSSNGTAAPDAETGSFMRGALQTAVGVAGGALLFEGVRSLLHSGSDGVGGFGAVDGDLLGNPQTVVDDTTINDTVLNDNGDGRSADSGLRSTDNPGTQDDDVPDWTSDTGDSNDPIDT